MPIQSVEYWEEKAWLAEEAAKKMSTAAAESAMLKSAMLEIAQLYRQLAEVTRRLKAAAGGRLLQQRHSTRAADIPVHSARIVSVVRSRWLQSASPTR
jgi:hypothetical protein